MAEEDIVPAVRVVSNVARPIPAQDRPPHRRCHRSGLLLRSDGRRHHGDEGVLDQQKEKHKDLTTKQMYTREEEREN